MSKRVLVPIADGSEEIEAVCLIDTLRRAGAAVTVASVMPQRSVQASRGVKLVADCLMGDCAGQEYDLIVLPGGMPGAAHLRDCAVLVQLLRHHAAAGKPYGAICAAPAVVLAHHGLLASKKATAHPNFVEQLPHRQAVEQRVVVDGNCLTSRGPGTALEFALQCVELLYGRDKATAVAAPMLAQCYRA